MPIRHWVLLFVGFYFFPEFNIARASKAPQQFCRAMQAIDWRDERKWHAALSIETGVKISPKASTAKSQKMNEVLESLSVLVMPKKLSRSLEREILDIEDPSIVYYKIPNLKFYFFGNTQGSGNCSNNIWARQAKNAEIEPFNPPIQRADECDAPVFFGNHSGDQLAIKLQYIRKSPKEKANPSAIFVAKVSPKGWSDICQIKIPLPK